ncbi:MAG: TMEM175 family protein [Lacisediminihabitans sp.]
MHTTRGLDRLVFFTDAVSAIAITLLILPLVDSVGAAAARGLDATQFIGANLNGIGAFALSFAVIAQLWMTHHTLFEHVKAYNRPLVLLSMLWAFTIVVLPLPTEMISQFKTSPASVGLYIGTMAVSSLAVTSMVLLIRRHAKIELTENPVTSSATSGSVISTILFFVALLIGVLIPAVNFFALLILLLGFPLQYFYGRRHTAKRATTPAN